MSRGLWGLILSGLSMALHAAPGLDADDLAAATLLRDSALNSDVAYELLESLTTEIGPRMAGSPNDARAVAWGVEKLQSLGFKNVHTQSFEFPLWRRGPESAEILAPFPQKLAFTALGGSIGSKPAGVTAEVVEVASFAALNDFPEAALRGKIAFINNRMADSRNGAGYGAAVVARTQGASAAAKKGALALVIRSIGTSNDRVAHTGIMNYDPTLTRIPAGAISNPDADLLAHMLKRGEPVKIRVIVGAKLSGTATSHNVIGDLPGSEFPDQYVVIGGHLDSWDLGTGALDDGAGVAITMAAAAHIGKHGPRPRRTIRVILWGNEEQGIWGGKAYAESQKNNLRQHWIGAESDFGAGKIYRFSSFTKPEALADIDKIMQVLAPLGIERGGTNASGGPDLGPMKALGMAMGGLEQDGTGYFDIHHTPNDTLDKVDPEALQQNVAAYVVFAYLSAQTRSDFGFGLTPPAAPVAR
jgi:carboxypeptidase Q